MRTGGQHGFTLVELLVVMVLLGVVATMVGSITIQALGSTRRTQERVYVTADIQKGAERMAQDLRVADPLVTAAAASVTAQVLREGTCLRRTYTHDPLAKTVSVTEKRYASVAVCSTASPVPTATATVVLLRGVTAPTGGMFTYQDAAGTALPASPSVPAMVRRIQLRVEGALRESTPPVRLATSVEVRNVR